MKKILRLISPIACVIGLAACALSSAQGTGATDKHGSACRKGGVQCRWDEQCCSDRCYVDIGCSG